MERSFGPADDLPRLDYRSPAERNRFKNGISGNPAGRPKGSSRTNAFEKLMQKTITVIEGGKRHKRPAEEVLLAQTLKAALAGDARARRDILRFIERRPKPKDPEGGLSPPGGTRIAFMQDSTELLLALEICVVVEDRSVLASWVIEAARERQRWTALSSEEEQLLDEFGEPGFKRAA